MKKHAWLVILAVLAGCEPTTPVPAQLASDFMLRIHWATSDEMAVVAREYGDPQADRGGYAVLRGFAGDWMCDVYMARPRNLGEVNQTLLGHEVMHCLYGNFHP
jgi:hypothetical protein